MGIVGGEEGGMAICPRSCVVRVESRGIVGGPVGHYIVVDVMDQAGGKSSYTNWLGTGYISKLSIAKLPLHHILAAHGSSF